MPHQWVETRSASVVYESTGSQPLLSSLGGCADAVLHRRFVYSWSGQPKAYSTQPSKEKHVKSWEFDQKGGLNPKVQVRISPLQIPVFQFSEKKKMQQPCGNSSHVGQFVSNTSHCYGSYHCQCHRHDQGGCCCFSPCCLRGVWVGPLPCPNEHM